MKRLDNVEVGTEITVKEIQKTSKIRRKLLDMGLTIGTKVIVKGKAPLGDPIEINLRGYKLTLRKEEACIVFGE
ncbi:MAG: FeoA family protein [Clostridium sp.]|uniref:FeoA family protein n=1 Tax=Clostridium sp. TaxID=1506 RepID=UPI003F2CBC38